jgi:hypothetical protein
MRKEIERAVRLLVGLPLQLPPGRAANMLTLGFGDIVTTTDFRGEPMEVPEHSLHVQCHWRLVRYAPTPQILVGSRDMYYPADLSTDLEDDSFQWDKPNANWCDRQFDLFATEYNSTPIVVEAVDADDYGGFRMQFSGSLALELFPDTSLHGEGKEHWRFFGAAEKPHFVVGESGIE